MCVQISFKTYIIWDETKWDPFDNSRAGEDRVHGSSHRAGRDQNEGI